MRRLALVAALAMLALPLAAGSASAALPPIHHVYVIVLENESVSTSFGPNSPAPYLAKTLRAQGAYVPKYFGIGHQSLDNYIAMISGQAPNLDTQTDCQVYSDFAGSSTGANGQVTGQGCVYPASVPTLPGQLSAAGLTLRDYNDGMGADPKRETSVCGHPAVNGRDNTQSASAADQYAARHNPFVYFHSIIDDTTLCDTHVVNLDALPQDLANTGTPNFVFITPNLCNDGHDAKCANGGPGGLPAVDTFLRKWVPQITSSPAYRLDGGLLLVLFDEAATSDTTSCCGEIAGPNSANPGLNGPGGGDVGAVLLSPYIAPGTVSQKSYNHYTMLRSIEDLYKLRHIGFAQLSGQQSFGSDIFACAPSSPPVARAGRLPTGSEFQNARVTRSHGRVTLSLYSVGNASLRVVPSSGRHRLAVIKRTLVPCTSYTISLPAGHNRHVTITAYANGGKQTLGLRY